MHLHVFTIRGARYAIQYDDVIEPIGQDADSVQLSELHAIEPGKTFEYEYDFGDSWRHEVLVESVKKLDPNKAYPYCDKAVRACPPEDCGGTHGYSRILRILKNPKHREYDEIVDWLGIDDFDPTRADVAEINRIFRIAFPF